jgi:hypothetical protein
LDGSGNIPGPAADGPGALWPPFPELPIINAGEVPAPPTVPAQARGQREKYGALFYLGIAGLVLLVALIAWFGHGLWTDRDIWADVYALNDIKRPESDRLDAALRLSRNPRLDDAARMEMSMRKDLPALARYLLAESVSTDLLAHDPRSYALTVARSEAWPDWLRLLLARRLAYGAGRGYDIPREALDELKRHSDPLIGLWAQYALDVRPGITIDPAMTTELEQSARASGPTGELAAGLLDAMRAAGDDRELRLDEATAWLRHHHPQAAEIWRGWEIHDQHVARKSVE